MILSVDCLRNFSKTWMIHLLFRHYYRNSVHILAEEKLVVTLGFFATEKTKESVMFQFQIYESTISQFIELAHRAIHNELAKDYMKTPDFEGEWDELIRGAEERWQFSNFFGVADGMNI